jgi:hypothetical protein
MRDDSLPPPGHCIECGERERERGDWCTGCWNRLVSEGMRERGIEVVREPQP